jgi:hypothetical protein
MPDFLPPAAPSSTCPARTELVELAIVELARGGALSPRAARVVEDLVRAPRTSLRYAVASSGFGCGPGCASLAAASLAEIGVEVARADLLAAWKLSHEVLDSWGAWARWDELRGVTRDACDYERSEGWRRALLAAYDAELAPGLEQRDHARAWAQVAVRWYALHLLGASLGEPAFADLRAIVRRWMPADTLRTGVEVPYGSGRVKI